MATHTIATAKIASHANTIVAATVDTVTFTDNVSVVEVLSDGAAALYVTPDGSTPTVGGDNCIVLPASLSAVQFRVTGQSIKLISSGTPTYSVTRAV